MKERFGIYPGSFGPLTNGHLNVVQHAAGLFDEVVVAVGINLANRTLFAVEERVAMIREAARELRNVAVEPFAGFKAETRDAVAAAEKMLREKGPDLVVANDVRVGFGGDETEVAFVSADGLERLPRMPKRAVAERLVALIAARLAR